MNDFLSAFETSFYTALGQAAPAAPTSPDDSTERTVLAAAITADTGVQQAAFAVLVADAVEVAQAVVMYRKMIWHLRSMLGGLSALGIEAAQLPSPIQRALRAGVEDEVKVNSGLAAAAAQIWSDYMTALEADADATLT